MNILFVCLTAFSRFGGIEKFNKAFIKALSANETVNPFIYCLYDIAPDSHYVESKKFKGFGGSRLKFVISAIQEAVKQDVVFIGHINLAVVALAKIIKPSLKVVLITHGIEVWRQLNPLKKWALQQVDQILAVSHHTKNELIQLHGVQPNKIKVFPNTIDPFFPVPNSFTKSAALLKRYHITVTDKVLLSVCRLSAAEAYKGYDTVLRALPMVLQEYPSLTYAVVGKYDEVEKERLLHLAKELQVLDNFKLLGFVHENELIDHFLLGDAFVMPSKNEGFGIVYIEAMACGIPVIAGNADGSVDALANGALGTLVDPGDVEAIGKAIIEAISGNYTYSDKQHLQNKVLARFSFTSYQNRLKEVLNNL